MLCKILRFFNLILKLFYNDLVLIKHHLILISYEKIGLHKKDRNKKTPNMDGMPSISQKIHFDP